MRREALSALGILALTALGGCVFSYDAAGPAMTYENRLAESIVISVESEELPDEQPVASGSFARLPTESCFGTALVVRTEAGGELVGRIEEPACPGAKLTINEDGTLDYSTG